MRSLTLTLQDIRDLQGGALVKVSDDAGGPMQVIPLAAAVSGNPERRGGDWSLTDEDTVVLSWNNTACLLEGDTLDVTTRAGDPISVRATAAS